MRLLSALILLFVAYVAAEEGTHTYTISKEFFENFMNCKKEFGIPPVYYDRIIDEVYASGKADKNHKCFELCLYKFYNVIINGQVDEDNLLKCHNAEDNPDRKEEILNCAKKTKGDDECDLAFNIEKCIYGFK